MTDDNDDDPVYIPSPTDIESNVEKEFDVEVLESEITEEDSDVVVYEIKVKK